MTSQHRPSRQDLQREETWNNNLRLLREFVESNGHSAVSPLYVVEGTQLGLWVNRVRRSYRDRNLETGLSRQAQLDPERLRELETLPHWDWDARSASWKKKFSLLQDWTLATGTSHVPTTYITSCGFRLGGWVSRQRKSYKTNTLSGDLIGLLEGLPDWKWEVAAQLRAQRSLVETRLRIALHQLYGGSPDDTVVKVDEKRLHCDVVLRSQNLVVEYDGAHWHTKLAAKDEAKTRALESAGWKVLRIREVPLPMLSASDVPISPTASVEELIRIALEGACALGFIPLPSAELDMDEILASSVTRLVSDDQWWRFLKAWQTYVERTGSQAINVRYVEGDVPLGQWVSVQRRSYRRGRLTSDKVAALEKDPQWEWAPRTGDWEEKVAAVAEWCSQNGHSFMQRAYTTTGGFNLGKWAMSQKIKYRRSELGLKRIAALEAIPEWSWSTMPSSWDSKVDEIRQWSLHADDPTFSQATIGQYKQQLWLWILKQKSLNRRGMLSEDRVRKLETIPNWSWDRLRKEDKNSRAKRLAESGSAIE